MKKRLMLLVAACMLFAGCARETEYEVANYQGELAKGQDTSDYNKELFYRNDKKTSGADPFVLDNTEVDGYYYMYVTSGMNFCYRSANLMDWEPVGNALGNWEYDDEGKIAEELKVSWKDVWASEVVYDEETENYYMFFSATPQADSKATGVEEGNAERQLLVAVSKFAYKDFQIVNFKDAKSCGEGNLHMYDESQYPHYYAKYLMFEPGMHTAFAAANGGAKEGSGGYTGAIDPHPFVDDNGDKYLFWKIETTPSRICVMKMENWLKPDWNTATVLTCSLYYTIEDWKSAQAVKTVEIVPYEDAAILNNEGPAVIKHNGKYYLTYSMNTYVDNSYQVGIAVADNIMGPYRKLTEEEGGILLSGATAGSQEISGTGHHSFVTVGEQNYIVYHRHDDFTAAGSARNHAIDELKWVTIKDKDGKDLDVMYINGPTCTVQPAVEAYSDYKNIADEATVTGTDDVSYLTDDLLSMLKYGNPTFMEYIKETTIQETTTFTFDFDSERAVRAILVYNSKMENAAFANISKIEFVCEENGKDVTRYIENVKFSSEYYKANDFDGTFYYVTPGVAAYAEFEELNAKSIRITVEVPKGQESVGISEIKILGK